MRLYWYFKNLLFLYRANKDISLIKRNHYEFIESCFNISRLKKYKSKIFRDLICSIIKQLRVVSPYKIQNYKEAQTLYEEYFTLENSIYSFEQLKTLLKKGDVWLIKFRNEYPVKGEKYFSSYFVNASFGGTDFAFKLGKYNEKWNYIDSDHHSINENEITMFKFATEQEIKISKERQSKKQQFQKDIDLKQKELSELYTQKSKL